MNAFPTICRYSDVPDKHRVLNAIDTIFFEASSVKSFASAAERDKFRERWLGRYLAANPQHAYLALDEASDIRGYLVGSFEQPEPDANPFAAFDELLLRFPAHLHVNVASRFRNRGIGGRLIDAFVADANGAGVRGMHVVTAATSENVRFYARNGFGEAARLRGDKPLVFLARALPALVTGS